MAPFFFHAFGLRIEADAPVPGFAPADAGPPQLRLVMGSEPAVFASAPPAWREIWRSDAEPGDPNDIVTLQATGDGAYLAIAYADGMRFVLARGGDAIWATWPMEFSVDMAATYLLGPVLGFALRLRGITCLHASAVVVGGAVIALSGVAGMGKSTTAAALALRGNRVIADDIAVLDHAGGGWRVHPSVPGVRLWEDSVAMLLGSPDRLPRLAEGWDKRVLDLRETSGGFHPERSEPLGAVYILAAPEDGASVRPIRLSRRDALMTLVSNTYANVLLDPPLRRQEFADLSALVAEVPVWRVPAPGSPAELERFCEMVEAADRPGGGSPEEA
jgi:hypothetical protein